MGLTVVVKPEGAGISDIYLTFILLPLNLRLWLRFTMR